MNIKSVYGFAYFDIFNSTLTVQTLSSCGPLMCIMLGFCQKLLLFSVLRFFYHT